MKVLEVPFTHNDMRISVSMSGITVLNEGRYKQRHDLSKELIQCPTTGIQLLKKYKASHSHEYPKKRHRKKNPSIVVQQITKVKQKRSYRIDKKQVTHRIKNYLNQMKGEKMLYFWTTTFPQGTTDDTAFILHNKWLTRLRQERMIKEYLWITERQENGTIHFHMVINHKMCVQKANRYMRASIMWSIKSGEINWTSEAAAKYNGIDIGKDRDTKRVVNYAKKNKAKALANYLVKYITKNNGEFTHLAWHSSRGYSNIVTQVRLTYKEFIQSKFEQLTDTSKPIISQYFTFTRWKGSPPKSLLQYLSFINQTIQSLLN